MKEPMKPMRCLGWLRCEEGSTLAAVMMVIMVVMAIGVSAIQVAQHSNDVTSVDRERVQTVVSAEAGIHDAIVRLTNGAGCDLAIASPTDLSDTTSVVGSYRTRIDPEAGTTCGQTLTRVIHSWGYAPTGGTRALRHLEVTVQMVPLDGFQFSLFAAGGSGTISVKNTGTVSGDIYAELLDQTHNNITAEDVVSPGSIDTKNDAVYSGTLWAGGNVTLRQNGRVGRSIIAAGTASGSQGTVTLENGVDIAGDVKAKGSVSLPTVYTVHGSVSQNNPNLPTPLVLELPTYTWDDTLPHPTPKYMESATSISSRLNTNRNALHGTYHSTPGDTGTVVIPNNVTVDGPLTIVSSGKIDLGRNMSYSGTTRHQVIIVALSNSTDAIEAAQNFAAAGGLDILLFTVGGVDIKNQLSMTGAVYANTIDIKNAMSLLRSEELAQNPPPGFNFDQTSVADFTVIPTLWREVVPGPPPT